MPWCEPCNRYLTPPSLEDDGSCPGCGTVLAEPRERVRVPWHFWLVAGSAGAYMGWRLIQGVMWLVHRM